MVARRGKCPKNHFFCIFGLLSYKYNLHQVGLEFRQLFYILVHPSVKHHFTTFMYNNSAGNYSSQTDQVNSLLYTCRLNWHSSREWSQIDHNDGHFLTTMEWQWFLARYHRSRWFFNGCFTSEPLLSMVFQWFFHISTIGINGFHRWTIAIEWMVFASPLTSMVVQWFWRKFAKGCKRLPKVAKSCQKLSKAVNLFIL